jgi:hypothetical protein
MPQAKVVQPLRARKEMKPKMLIAIPPLEYLTIEVDGPSVRIGNWTVEAKQRTEKDWNYYSKTWQRERRIPKITISDRRVVFTSDKGAVRTAYFDHWRGSWRERALLDAKLVKPKQFQKHIRLNPVFDIELIGNRFGFKFYIRSLKGIPVDYCIVSPTRLTYHARSVSMCFAGLRKKASEIEVRKTAFVDLTYLRKLGFCEQGILEFCSLLDFDPCDRYAPQSVLDRIDECPELAKPFQREIQIFLKSLGLGVETPHA